VSVADFPESETVVAEEYKNGVVEMVIDSFQKLFDACVHRGRQIQGVVTERVHPEEFAFWMVLEGDREVLGEIHDAISATLWSRTSVHPEFLDGRQLFHVRSHVEICRRTGESFAIVVENPHGRFVFRVRRYVS
jgi:hypothetical protein